MLSLFIFVFAVKSAEVEKEMEQVNIKPNVDIRLNDLKLVLGPELRIVYPLILNFAVSGELELNGLAHPKLLKPKGILTFENGDVNLVATQVSLVFLYFILYGQIFWHYCFLPFCIYIDFAFSEYCYEQMIFPMTVEA